MNDMPFLKTTMYRGKDQLAAAEDPQPTPEVDPVENLEAVTPEEETWKKRHGDLRRFNQRQLEERDTEIAELKSKANEIPDFVPPKTKEELEEYRKTDPALFELLQSMIHDMSTPATQRLDEVQKALDDERQKNSDFKALNEITKKHPDWEDISGTDEFAEWLSRKPNQYQDWALNAKESEAVIFILDEYKDETKPKDTPQDDKRRADLVAASEFVSSHRGDIETAEVGKGPIFKASEIKSMHPAVYEKNYDAIMKARAAGRIDVNN